MFLCIYIHGVIREEPFHFLFVECWPVTRLYLFILVSGLWWCLVKTIAEMFWVEKKSFRAKLSIFEGKYKENKLLSCGHTLDLWWNWEQNQNFSNAVLPQRDAVLLCALTQTPGSAFAVTEEGQRLQHKFGSMGLWNMAQMNDLPSYKPSPWQRFYIPKAALFQRILVDLQPFLAHCTNAVVCACLFFWRIAAADAVVWHLTPALPFWDTAKSKSVPAAAGGRDQCLRSLVCSLWDSLCLNTASRRAAILTSLQPQPAPTVKLLWG